MRTTTSSAVLASLVTLFIAKADCPQPGWQPGFGAPGVSSSQVTPQVNALHVWDPDGPGGPLTPVLVVGGVFTTAGGASSIEGEPVSHITVWDGDTFRGTLPGLNGQVLCVEVDDANMLYIGGHFTSTPTGPANSLPRIARFDTGLGIWRGLAGDGFNGQVNALHTEPSGNLLVGGSFANFFSGGVANHLARWNGTAWSTVTWMADGSIGAPTNVWSFGARPDPEHPTVVGLDTGPCATSPPNSACACVRAPTWEGDFPLFVVTGPVAGRVYAQLQSQNGRHWVAGSFTQVRDYIAAEPLPLLEYRPALGVAFNDPEDGWVQAGAGFDGPVHALLADGNTVYAGGRFTHSGSTQVNNIARWDGSAWQPMGAGFDADVFALAIYNGELYAGGIFGRLGNGVDVHGIARWNGSEWRGLGNGSYPVQSSSAITCVAKFENRVVAAGRFTTIGGVAARRVARLTGGEWVQIGQGFEDYPHAMVELEDGNLYALGMTEAAQPANEYHRLQRFEPNGALWVDLGGFDQYFSEAVLWNGQLVVGGWFTASGATPLNRIAIRDGNGTWQQMGAGFNSVVTALTLFNGELIAGGYFTMSGSTPVTRVARWDGTAWQPMGSGLAGNGQAAAVLHVHNGQLYAGGDFYGYLSRWTGSTWEQVGDPAAFGGCFGGVSSLATYYDDLIVSGSFSCGQVGILRWNGVSYGPMAAGAPPVPNVANLVTIGGDLWMNGVFNAAGGLPASGIAVWRDQTPWIIVEPAPVTANVGDDVTLTASAHSDGFPPIVYFQWFHNDQEIPGADLPTLTLSDVQPADAGDYRCSMDAFCDFAPVTVESNIVTVTVEGGGNPCPGDLDSDGSVNLQDLATLLSRFGTPGGALPEDGDIDGDGDVDLQDLANLLAHFGTTCP